MYYKEPQVCYCKLIMKIHTLLALKISNLEKGAQTGLVPDILLQDDHFKGHLAA